MTFNPAIQCLQAFDPNGIEVNQITRALHDAAQLKAMADSAWLAVANRAEQLGAARELGYRTTTDLIVATTGDRRGHAMRDVELGKQLAAAPVVSSPFAAGDLTRTKVTEILRANGATDTEQRSLVKTAKASSVKKLRELVDAYLAERNIEPAPIENRLTINHGQGGGKITVTLEPVRLNLLEIALDMATTQLGLPKDLPYAQRRAEALVAIAKFFVEHAHNTTHVRGSRPHVSVIVDLDTLESRANRPARLENGQHITGEAARQMCCDAGITRIITDPRSQPLDVGTETRTFPAAMARAIIARDKHCVHPGCEAPPWACEIHHRQHFAHAGPTSAENGELRCWHHHDLQHQNDKQHDRDHLNNVCLAA